MPTHRPPGQSSNPPPPSKSSKQPHPEQQAQSQGAAPQKKLELTLGCEIECVLVVSSNKPVDGHDIIREVLGGGRGELKAKCAFCGNPETVDLLLWPDWDQNNDPSRWAVDADPTANQTEREVTALGPNWMHYQFFPIEIRSRMMHRERLFEGRKGCAKRRGGRHEFTYEAEIKAVTTALDDHFCNDNRQNKSQYVYVNERCGLHIHVGNGPKGELGFELPTVQRIFAAYTACERQMDGFHPKSRINGSNILTAKEPPVGQLYSITDRYNIDEEVYNKPPSLFFLARAHNRRLADEPDASVIFKNPKWRSDANNWVKLILGADTEEKFASLYNGFSRECNINLLYAMKTSDPGDRGGSRGRSRSRTTSTRPSRFTIEFRQHAGTLQAEAISNYIELLTKFLSYVHSMTDDEFLRMFGEDGEFRKKEMNPISLCRKIGCRATTVAYYIDHLGADPGSIIPYMPNRMYHQMDLCTKKANEMSRDPLAGLIMANIQVEWFNMHPVTVRDCMIKKVLAGGYGQLTKDDLRYLVPIEERPPPTKQNKLMIKCVEQKFLERVVTPAVQQPEIPRFLSISEEFWKITSTYSPPESLYAPSFISPTEELMARRPLLQASSEELSGGEYATESSEGLMMPAARSQMVRPSQRATEKSIVAQPFMDLRRAATDPRTAKAYDNRMDPQPSTGPKRAATDISRERVVEARDQPRAASRRATELREYESGSTSTSNRAPSSDRAPSSSRERSSTREPSERERHRSQPPRDRGRREETSDSEDDRSRHRRHGSERPKKAKSRYQETSTRDRPTDSSSKRDASRHQRR